jgi:hypothetical protein
MKVFWKRVILTICLSPILLFCLLVCWLVLIYVNSHISHDQILKGYEKQFYEIVHPPNTSVVAFKSEVNRSPGNGHVCYYFIGYVRKFEGNPSKIEAFYQNEPVELEFLENRQFGKPVGMFGKFRVPYELHQLENWHISPNNFSNKLYLVYILLANYDEQESLDLRCI